jgi:uncharacterized membrane protein
VNVRPYLITAAVVVLLMLGISAWAWPQIPAGVQVPIHWGIDGQANGWASKPIALFGVPLLTAGIALLLAFAPRLDPRYGNVARSATAYLGVAFAVLVLMLVIHSAAILAATGRAIEIGTVARLAVGSLLIVVGNFLGKTRSSWVFGIRTPWTLSSERSWARTHRLGGYLFMLVGAASIVAGVFAPQGVAAVVLLVGLGVVVVTVAVYSYLVWRTDPDRQQTGSAR